MTSTALSIEPTTTAPLILEERGARGVAALARQYLEEGVVQIQMGEAKAAVEALTRAVAQAPEYSDAHVFLGIAHALDHNVYPALDHLEEAARLDADSFAAHYTLAQLNFKLRIPQKGYEAAERARQTAVTLEQRKLLTNLLREEKVREKNGIARPTFNKGFGIRMLFVAGSGLAAAILTVIRHMH